MLTYGTVDYSRCVLNRMINICANEGEIKNASKIPTINDMMASGKFDSQGFIDKVGFIASRITGKITAIEEEDLYNDHIKYTIECDTDLKWSYDDNYKIVKEQLIMNSI